MSAEPRCDHCKHWKLPTPPIEEVGECTRALMLWDCTVWRRDDDDFDRVIEPKHADVMMFVQDGSDYQAYLYTRPQFSCASFEAK